MLTNFNFPKSARIHRRLEFRDALDNGVKTVCGDMVIFCRDFSANATISSASKSPPPLPSLGLIVSRKVGGSVQRNQVKRHLRESFRQLRPLLAEVEAFQHKNIVIIARPNLAARTQAEVATSLRYCLKRYERIHKQQVKLP